MTGPNMHAGVVLPGGTANQQLEQAVAAEQAGWDGVFVWEAGYGVDAGTLLAALAARTRRVRPGTLPPPLPWRRPGEGGTPGGAPGPAARGPGGPAGGGGGPPPP